MIREFREFIARGNVIDLAVAVVIFTLAGVVHLSARTDRVTQESLSIQENTRRSQKELP